MSFLSNLPSALLGLQLALDPLLPQQFMWLWGALAEEGLTQHCSAWLSLASPGCLRWDWKGGGPGGLWDPAALWQTGAVWEAGYPGGLQAPLNKVSALQWALACSRVTQESLFHLALLLFSKRLVNHQLSVTSKRLVQKESSGTFTMLVGSEHLNLVFSEGTV